MRIIKIALLLVSIISLTSCASGYKMIDPQSINYASANEHDKVKLEYKYDLLEKKYARKETKKGLKLVAVKVTNQSDKDLMFGREIKLEYADGSEILAIDNKKVYRSLRQSTATYLLYLLLTPLQFNVTKSDGNGTQTDSTPIGLVVGPGITGINMITASSANKKFKTELLRYDINGTIVKKGETKYGLIAIKSHSYDALKIKVE